MAVEGRILVFAKAPIPGQVKTRLIPVLGKEGAAVLFERLVHHTLSVATTALRTGVGGVELHCAPDITHPFFTACAQGHGVQLRKQVQGDLGDRLYAAATEGLKSADRVVIIGCDCPVLKVKDIEDAWRALDSGVGAVLGPAEDGGYYLVGLRRCDSNLFKGINWGSEKVLEQTRDLLRKFNWTWQELEMNWDLDTSKDYDRFVAERITL
ncbi:MAG: TIGR04282 family arsenosugar biosynthesis glycosyltransferase [Burkholderiales bacterium]